METLILKIVISSCLLIGFYYLFLERERTFKFNRVFLLLTLVFAYVVPFIALPILFKNTVKTNLIIGESVQDLPQISVIETASIDWIKILTIAYITVSILFLIKFVYSIIKIKLLKGEKRQYLNQQIVILDKNYAPFSFLNTIYFSKNQIVDNQIDERIFIHEKCHTEDKHSLDILFIEFLKIFSWFNPALFFYKKAMVDNHEFLADQYVLQNNYDLENYQHLVLNEIKRAQNFNLTHQFDFNNTKKRFIMMTSKNSRFMWLKKLTLLPVLAILFVLFTKKVNAQTENTPISETTPIKTGKKNVAIPIDDKIMKLERSELSVDAKKILRDLNLKKDTIKTKQKVQAPIELPAPPSPSEFKQDPAQFPDGMNVLRSLISNNFNTSIFNGIEGLVKTTLYLSVDETGNVSNVFAEGDNLKFNEEAVRSFNVANAGKIWKPATENGQGVKTVYKIPLTMQFEGPASKK